MTAPTLFRRGAKLFRHERSHAGSSGATSTASIAVPPTITEYFDEDAITAATTASLVDENSRLTSQLEEQKTRISRLEHASSQQNQEISVLNSVVDARTAEKTALERSLRSAQNGLRNSRNHGSHELESLQRERAQLQTENAAIRADLRGLHAAHHANEREYKTLVSRMENTLTTNQDLKQRLSAALSSIPQASLHIYYDHLAEIHSKQELEAAFVTEKAAMTAEIASLKAEIHSKQELEANFVTAKAAMTREIASLKVAISANDHESVRKDKRIYQLEVELESQGNINQELKYRIESQKKIFREQNVAMRTMERELEEMRTSQSQLLAIVGDATGGITPRQIIRLALLRSGESTLPPHQAEQPPDAALFMQTHNAEHLQAAFLDLALTNLAHAADFARSIAPGTPASASVSAIRLQPCSVCRKSRFTVEQPTSGSPNRELDEFPQHSRTTTCCSSAICSHCLADSIKDSIAEDLWDHIDSASFLSCPKGDCDTPMGICSVEQVADILRHAGAKDARETLSKFVHLWNKM
jgi:hypothetical protein